MNTYYVILYSLNIHTMERVIAICDTYEHGVQQFERLKENFNAQFTAIGGICLKLQQITVDPTGLVWRQEEKLFYEM